jgi:hypothetical protein
MFFGSGCSDVSKKVAENSDNASVKVADVGMDKSEYEVFDRDGIHFKYPKGLKVTYGGFSVDSNISVVKKAVDDYAESCEKMFEGRASYGDKLWMVGYKQKERLLKLKKEGLNGSNYSDLIQIDPVECQTSYSDDISEHVYKFVPWTDGKTKGVIRYQKRWDDCCSIQNFTVELTALNKYDELVTILNINSSIICRERFSRILSRSKTRRL